MKREILKNIPIICFFILSIPSKVVLCQSDRVQWQPPEKIMNAIGVKPGMIIGEAGAGSGYFTIPLSKRIEKDGKVFANDISERSLKVLRNRMQDEEIENIEIVLGETEDPLFPEKNLDMIIMVYVLHCLEKPVIFMKNIKKYMRSDTPLVIIERNTHQERAHYPAFMTKKQILETMQNTDYKLERTETFLPKDTIYIFKLKKM